MREGGGREGKEGRKVGEKGDERESEGEGGRLRHAGSLQASLSGTLREPIYHEQGSGMRSAEEAAHLHTCPPSSLLEGRQTVNERLEKQQRHILSESPWS